MELEDLASTESAVAAAATATVLSPRLRGALRRGAVYGVAGVLKAGDVVVGAARGAARGMRDGQMPAGGGEASETAEPAPPSEPAPPPTSPPRGAATRTTRRRTGGAA